MKRKILITGISGLLGSNLVNAMASHYEVYGLCRQEEPIPEGLAAEYIDITDNRKVRDYLKQIEPDIVVHCAALTDVDYCEEFPKEAEFINTQAAANLAKATKDVGARFIHISTDHIFDGEKGDYKEDDEPRPLNVYARTKLEAEKTIRDIIKDHTIIRTSFYGFSMLKGLTFAEWVMDAAFGGKSITLFDDFIFTPLLVNNLASAIEEIIAKSIYGTLHIASPDYYTKFEFGRKLLEGFGIGIEKTNIRRGKMSDVKMKARRPQNLSLNTEKAKKALDTKLLSVEDGIKSFRELWDIDYGLIKSELKDRIENV